MITRRANDSEQLG